ncbi:MAG: serpin family protein [Chitinispirillaceae bacterium]|nr:serpin family protein [Chitinispirillaceae bacterium]
MKWFRAAFLFSIVMLYAGCTRNPVGSPGSEAGTISSDPDAPFPVVRSASITRENSFVPGDQLAEQAASNNAFAVAMYKELIAEGENLFFSPYSITAALAMTAAGGAGETRQQIRDALQVTLEADDFDAAINGIDLSLMTYADATEGVTLRVVNSTWMQVGWQFKVSFLDHLSRFYGAGVNLMNFVSEPEECRTVINTWVADQTNQKIENLLTEGSITPATVLVLTNAIYFLGDWIYSFDPEYTSEIDFTTSGSTTVRAPVMRYDEPGKNVTMRYSRIGNARALDFPYKGDRLVMTVILPDNNEFITFESSLNLEVIDELIAALDSTELQVSLPKFEFTYGTESLKDALIALGMTDPFIAGKADFSGIDGSTTLYIADVLHKAFIAVDEEGTEAAAATAVIIERSSWDPDEAVFNVDRPFIYVIRDKQTGTILFMGRTIDPTAKE